MHQKHHRDGWASAMEPTFVARPTRDKHVSMTEKKREADALHARVQAHLASGGAYIVLPTTPEPQEGV